MKLATNRPANGPFSAKTREAVAAVALSLGSQMALAAPAVPSTDQELQTILQQRFQSDRSGTCVVAAVVDAQGVRKARYCGLPRADGGPAIDATFEIGSITKTMTAFLVSDLIDKGKWSLDDPIAIHLPKGTQVPQQGERQILVRDLLTHRSGLGPIPSRMKRGPDNDPYSKLTEGDLLDSLNNAPLTAPIGSRMEYSNFGMMVLSLAVANAYGRDFETVLTTALFEPLDMQSAQVLKPRSRNSMALGHTGGGLRTPAWKVPVNLAGVGMVRASVDDMVKYAQAHLGLVNTPLKARLQATHQALSPEVAMNWFIETHDGKTYLAHGGGTGGFASNLMMDVPNRRAVIVLSDTANQTLAKLSQRLMGLEGEMEKPRLAAPLPANLRKALPGMYRVVGKELSIWEKDGRLWERTEGQDQDYEVLYDNQGDVYSTGHGIGATPVWSNQQLVALQIQSDDVLLEAWRAGATRPAPSASKPEWQAWAGEYTIASQNILERIVGSLMPSVTLRVFELNKQMRIELTDQPSLAAAVIGPDRIEVRSVGAVIHFQRDAKGSVTGLTLTQNGQTLQGKKQ